MKKNGTTAQDTKEAEYETQCDRFASFAEDMFQRITDHLEWVKTGVDDGQFLTVLESFMKIAREAERAGLEAEARLDRIWDLEEEMGIKTDKKD